MQGAYHRDNIQHYWNTHDEALRVDLIADSMKEDRYKEIMSHLSFLRSGDTSHPDHPLRKMHDVDIALMEACRDAWDVEQNAVPGDAVTVLTKHIITDLLLDSSPPLLNPSRRCCSSTSFSRGPTLAINGVPT
jgi:hypothetical protein